MYLFKIPLDLEQVRIFFFLNLQVRMLVVPKLSAPIIYFLLTIAPRYIKLQG